MYNGNETSVTNYDMGKGRESGISFRRINVLRDCFHRRAETAFFWNWTKAYFLTRNFN